MRPSHILRSTCVVAACVVALSAAASASAAGSWPQGIARISVATTRVVGDDIFDSARRAAVSSYPEWAGVDDVVVASGDASALSDAAVASSLCWAYDAPLLLVSRTAIPESTRAALAQIVSANPRVSVHVVGSSRAVSEGTLAQLRSAVPAGVVEQPWKNADRFSLAAAVAQRVKEVAASTSRAIPSAVLVANGSKSRLLRDAAAASAVSRHTGIPLLLCGTNSVPASTAAAIAAMGARVVVVGGPVAVSDAVYARLGASERWGGANRYAAAAAVARSSASQGFSSVATFGVAATIPNAVVAAQLVGAQGGVLLYSDADRINKTTWSYLSEQASTTVAAYAVGGSSISDTQLAELRGAAAKPALSSTVPARYVGKRFRVSGWVGGNTTAVSIYVGGKKVRSIPVKPWSAFSIASVAMPSSSTSVRAVAENPDGSGGEASRGIKRLRYPSATCIVIDKSDFKLYWVKNNSLVKAYPIAIGRLGMETPAPATWKILAKYRTSPGSVYGPRKMRLFRLRGGRFVFSAYGIHGTNQEWVIGTKASHGCIRMYNHDVLELFPHVPMGTMVYTRP